MRKPRVRIRTEFWTCMEHREWRRRYLNLARLLFVQSIIPLIAIMLGNFTILFIMQGLMWIFGLLMIYSHSKWEKEEPSDDYMEEMKWKKMKKGREKTAMRKPRR